MILRDFQEADNSDQQNEDREPVSRVAETERGSYGGKGGEPLQADRRPGDGPQFDRRQGEDGDGADQQPCNPTKEDLGCHVSGLADCAAQGHGSFGLFNGEINPH